MNTKKIENVSYKDYWVLADLVEIEHIKMIAQVEFHPQYGEKNVSSR